MSKQAISTSKFTVVTLTSAEPEHTKFKLKFDPSGQMIHYSFLPTVVHTNQNSSKMPKENKLSLKNPILKQSKPSKEKVLTNGSKKLENYIPSLLFPSHLRVTGGAFRGPHKK